jgi:hypothetical protein
VVAPALETLYGRALRELAPRLAQGARIAMVWPIFAAANGMRLLAPDRAGLTFEPLLPEPLRRSYRDSLTARDTVVYARPGARVRREIVVLGK